MTVIYLRALLVLQIGVLLAPNLVGQIAEEGVTVSFRFSDDRVVETTVTDAEVRQLLDRNFGYMVEWWIHGALSKLKLQYREVVVDADTKDREIVSIDGVANGPGGKWAYLVNGYRSPYNLNSQVRDDN